jgi:hypothetical protein
LERAIFRPSSNPNPLRACNSDLAQHSNTPTLHTPRIEDEDEDEDDDDENEACSGIERMLSVQR